MSPADEQALAADVLQTALRAEPTLIGQVRSGAVWCRALKCCTVRRQPGAALSGVLLCAAAHVQSAGNVDVHTPCESVLKGTGLEKPVLVLTTG